MLDYNDVKRFYASKLAEDLDGTGRVESAFYHTMKMVYAAGVADGKTGSVGVEDHKKPKVPAGYTEEELERDNPHNAWMNP